MEEETLAMYAAKCERIRNVLDNRGLVYDEELVLSLANTDEESFRQYLVGQGVEPQDPLDNRKETDLEVGRMVD